MIPPINNNQNEQNDLVHPEMFSVIPENQNLQNGLGSAIVVPVMYGNQNTVSS